MGQILIMRMKGRKTILGRCCPRWMLFLVYAVLGVCRTQCMLYWVYALLGVNLWSWSGEIERDDLTLCSAMMVELWMRKREMGDKDRNDVEDTSRYEKSGIRLAWLGWESLESTCTNGAGPSLRVRVRVEIEQLPYWRSGLSINPNRYLGYCSKVNSQLVWTGRVVCGLPSGSIYRFK